MLRLESGGTGNLASFYDQHDQNHNSDFNIENLRVDIDEDGIGNGIIYKYKDNDDAFNQTTEYHPR